MYVYSQYICLYLFIFPNISQFDSGNKKEDYKRMNPGWHPKTGNRLIYPFISLATSTSTLTTRLIYQSIFSNIVVSPCYAREKEGACYIFSCVFGHFPWLKVVTTYWRAHNAILCLTLPLLLVTFHDKTCFCLFKVLFLLNDVKPKRLSEGANMFHTLVFRFRTFFWLQFMWEKNLVWSFVIHVLMSKLESNLGRKERGYWKLFQFVCPQFHSAQYKFGLVSRKMERKSMFRAENPSHGTSIGRAGGY